MQEGNWWESQLKKLKEKGFFPDSLSLPSVEEGPLFLLALNGNYEQLSCILDEQKKTVRDSEDPIWISLFLLHFADDKEFLSKINRLSPQEWKDLSKYVSVFLQKHLLTSRRRNPCVVQPFRVVRKYLKMEEKHETKTLQGYQIIRLLPYQFLHELNFPKEPIHLYLRTHCATAIFGKKFEIELRKVGIPPIFGITYAFIHFLLPLEYYLHQLIFKMYRLADTSSFNILSELKFMEERVGDETESDRERKRAYMQIHLFLTSLHNCSMSEINQTIVHVFEKRKTWETYQELLQKQDISGYRRLPRYPLILVDDQRQYVGHIYIFEEVEKRCEMRGIRVGITRLIQNACQGKKQDQGVLYRLLKSGVLPYCTKLGLQQVSVHPLSGSSVEWLKKNRLQWPKDTKSVSELDKLLSQDYTIPDLTSSLF